MRERFTIAHVDAERGFSGGEVQVFLLMEGLRSLGHRCVIVAPPGSQAEAQARDRDFEVATAPMRNLLDLTGALAIQRALARIEPDLVHLHTGRATWLGGVAAWRARIPALTTRRMDRPLRRGARTRITYQKLVRRVVAISPAIAEQLVAGGVDRERIAVVPSAIDRARLVVARGRDAVRAEFGAGRDDIVVLGLGALVPRKGFDVLLRALAELARRGVRPRAWIAGDGAEREPLERAARTAGLASDVRFLGRRADVGDLLAGCDVFCLPSRAEGLGVAALEAMAAGRAVVATRVGGLGDAVVDGRTGLLVAPDDAAALALALERLVLDGALRARFGAEGPARVAEGFLPEQMVASYAALYREILAPAEVR